MPAKNSSPLSSASYGKRLKDLASFILLLWVIELTDRFLFGHSLQSHGIRPRSFSQISGILTAPSLHTTWSHLIGNSVSLLILGALILASGWRNLSAVSISAAVIGGVTVWLLGQSGTNHIGASSIVFGYLAFLLASGFYRPSPSTILISLAVLLFYGGSLWGILPTTSTRAAGISWEGHLGGAIGGLIVARDRRRKFASHRDPMAR
jgi:membrane associated rhomboid family serine protease